jgi:hypothetical protein
MRESDTDAKAFHEASGGAGPAGKGASVTVSDRDRLPDVCGSAS